MDENRTFDKKSRWVQYAVKSDKAINPFREAQQQLEDINAQARDTQDELQNEIKELKAYYREYLEFLEGESSALQKQIHTNEERIKQFEKFSSTTEHQNLESHE